MTEAFDLDTWKASLIYRAFVVRTRTGDQLHRVSSITRAGEQHHCRGRTDCGCKVARVIQDTKPIRYRAGLLCVKCFPRMPDNEKLIGVQFSGEPGADQ